MSIGVGASEANRVSSVVSVHAGGRDDNRAGTNAAP
jgi:hypothetical protein